MTSPACRVAWYDSATVPPAEDEEITQVDIDIGDFSAAPTRERHVLMRLDGTDAGQSTRVTPTPLLIGRSSSSDLVIADRSASREHARLVLTERGVACTDLGSRFGTRLNGNLRRQFVMQPGDWVQFGQLARFSLSLLSAEEERVLCHMRESSVHDALTMAFTRQYFEQRLASECSHATRHGDSLALLLLDLDHFKQVNDHYGHQAGDAVLRHVTGLMQQRLRSTDILARFGGEEFVVILRRADLEAARRVAERIRSTVATSPVYHCGRTIPVTVSIGCSACHAGGHFVGEELVAQADFRLYLAKGNGRNRVVFADATD